MAEYIEREDLINKICNEKCHSEYGRCQKRLHDDKIFLCVCDFIMWQPAADVTPVRHGRWEVVKGVFTPGGDPLLRCPFCKAKESEHLCGVESRVDWNYCPNCGAKMDAED